MAGHHPTFMQRERRLPQIQLTKRVPTRMPTMMQSNKIAPDMLFQSRPVTPMPVFMRSIKIKPEQAGDPVDEALPSRAALKPISLTPIQRAWTE